MFKKSQLISNLLYAYIMAKIYQNEKINIIGYFYNMVFD